MSSLLVIPKKNADLKLLEAFLKTSSQVKSVTVIDSTSSKSGKRKKEISLPRISESALAKEWLSKEDERWNDLLK